MNKLVYLYELDSVYTSPSDVKMAQKTLFQEIYRKGNQIALSFNQLIDSKAFHALIQNDRIYPKILSLFNQGIIRLVRFIDKTQIIEPEIRTPVQYFINALKSPSSKPFLFSSLPISPDNICLKRIIEQSLRLNDLTIFQDLITIKKELSSNSPCNLAVRNAIKNLTLSDLKLILRIIELVLQLSLQSLPYIKAFLNKKTLSDFLDVALNPSFSAVMPDVYSRAVKTLYDIKIKLSPDQINSRSTWLKQLSNDSHLDYIFMARTIINLCYNLAIEDCIENISKHYKASCYSNSDLQYFMIKQIEAEYKKYITSQKTPKKISEKFHHLCSTNFGYKIRTLFSQLKWSQSVFILSAFRNNSLFYCGTQYEEWHKIQRFLWHLRLSYNYILVFFKSSFCIVTLLTISLLFNNLEEPPKLIENFFPTYHFTLATIVLSDFFIALLNYALSKKTQLWPSLDLTQGIYCSFRCLLSLIELWCYELCALIKYIFLKLKRIYMILKLSCIILKYVLSSRI